MNTLPISIVIPTVNRPNSLLNTIESYIKYHYIPDQIIVVDQSLDCSTKNNLLVLKNCKNTNIEYIYQEKPSSTVARNMGIQRAYNEIIIFSDDDINIYNNTLLNIYHMMQNKNIAMIAALDTNSIRKNKIELGYLAGLKSIKNRKIGHVTLSLLGRYPNVVVGEISTQWAMGYCFAVRRSLLNCWGIKWDENLNGYAYAEDLDFSYGYYKVANSNNMRCILTDKVKVKHLVSHEYRIPNKEATYKYIANRLYLSHKHHMGIKSFWAMLWTNLFMIILRAIKNRNAFDMIEAQILALRNKNKIYSGRF
ncbi:glycosyltransferase family 2 protein [Bilophila wadsworthia]